MSWEVEMKCPACGAENLSEQKFCNECAEPFKKRCAKCGYENAPTAKFCGECAASLASSESSSITRFTSPPVSFGPEQTLGDSAALEGERKIVTALFADIKGSTELMRDLDPEEARAIVDPALKLMIDAVHRYDGYVVQSTGDGIFALFGAPVAHEDHPQRAVHAALVARADLRRRSDELRTRGRAGVEVRIGINTGEVVMRSVQTGGHIEYSPVGHVINLASRMQSVAPADGIVVSEDTRHLVEGYFELRDLGPTEVKGVAGTIIVYEVAGTGALRGHFDAAAQRGLTPFVGRERELEQLQCALELTSAGNGQIVAVTAEAGTGKSRLMYEFKRLFPKRCKLLEAYSVSHGKASPWLPVLELLRRYFGIADAYDASVRREKVRAALAALDPALSDTLPYLFALLGIVEGSDPIVQMDPQIKHRRTLDAIKRIVLRESLNQPLVVIFEDLHWIDGETQALLDVLADSVVNFRVLLLMTYRPEYRQKWGGRSYYTQIGLHSLDGDGTAQLLAGLLGEAVEFGSLKLLIAEKTEGNPFFIEEIVRALFEQGSLSSEGRLRLARPLTEIKIPPTVQAVLASRIDRLTQNQKDLFQVLAIIGRKFSLELIRQVAGDSEVDLECRLADLQQREFIYEKSAFPHHEYSFKHALTQEVAYNSVLIGLRKLIHQRTAQAIETVFASSLGDHYSELAHHYSRSPDAEKAIEYLHLAGQQAVQRSANAEAITYFNAALSLMLTRQDTPERAASELTLQFALGPSLQASKGWAAPEVERAYSRALELSQRTGETSHLFSALFGLQALYAHRPKLHEARKLAERGLGLAQRAHDPALLLEACHMLGYNLLYLGEMSLARQYSEQGMALYEPRYHSLAFLYGGDDPGVCCLCHGALALWFLGYPEQALKRAQAAIALARRLSHPLSQALALIFASILHQLRREENAIRELTDEALAISADHGFRYFSAWGTILQGWVLTEQGQGARIDLMREGLAAYQATGAASFRSYHLALITEGHRVAGHVDKGLALLAEALKWANDNDERFYEPELHRLKGELLMSHHVPRPDLEHSDPSSASEIGESDLAEIESCFRQAINIARKQGAKSIELRATMSLARLLRDTSRRDEAHTQLSRIYKCFTEGFDTADLKDASSLLSELGK